MRFCRHLFTLCIASTSCIAITPAVAVNEVTLVPVPIPAAAIADDPTLANALSFDLTATTDDDIFSVVLDLNVVGGTLYNHPLGSDIPPDASDVAANPALAFDSHTALPVTNPGSGTPESLFYTYPSSLSDALPLHIEYFGIAEEGAQTDFSVSRLTLIPNGIEPLSYSVSGTVDVRAIDSNPNRIAFDFCVNNSACPVTGDFDGDRDVDLDDFNILAAEFDITKVVPPGGGGIPGDFRMDFDVDINDFHLWARNFGCREGTTPECTSDWRGADMRGDGDNDVDVDDFNIMAANFGTGVLQLAADTDGNEDVDLADFNVLAANFGIGTAEQPGALPEPGVGVVLLVGCTLLRRRS